MARMRTATTPNIAPVCRLPSCAPAFPQKGNPAAELSATTHTVHDYVEERPGENGLLESAADAKRTIRRRIAELVSQDAPVPCPVSNGAEGATGKSTRGGRRVEEGDVFLFPGGMAAIWHAHQMILGVSPPMKSVCFGYVFPSVSMLLY